MHTDRYLQEKDEYGAVKGSIKCVIFRLRHITVVLIRFTRPFIIDLESTNGTHVNGETIPKSRYYELRASDGTCLFIHFRTGLESYMIVIKFGLSPREYVLLHDDAS